MNMSFGDWEEDIETCQNRIGTNLRKIKEKIAHSNIKIIAVTKYYSENAIIAGYNCGIRDFAESRIPDCIGKIDKLPNEIKMNSTFHYIGRLQSNKIEKVVKFFDVIHSVDSLRFAQLISQRACSLNKRERIFLQVNNANEEQKGGFLKQELLDNMEELLQLDGIDIIGLMNIAPINASDDKLHELFADIRDLKSIIENQYHINLPELSMGMSNDYQIATQEGATTIRIGRELFK